MWRDHKAGVVKRAKTTTETSNIERMEATAASATIKKTAQECEFLPGEKSRYGYLPIPAIDCKEEWSEIKQILVEAEPVGLTELHKLIHSVMKERNIPVPTIDGK